LRQTEREVVASKKSERCNLKALMVTSLFKEGKKETWREKVEGGGGEALLIDTSILFRWTLMVPF
jgi:hypothetical protein